MDKFSICGGTGSGGLAMLFEEYCIYGELFCAVKQEELKR
jgi:hypothetical protein